MNQLCLRNNKTIDMSKQDSSNLNKRNKFESSSGSSDTPNRDISNNELARLMASQNKATQDQISQLGSELREELSRGMEDIRADFADISSKLSQVKLDVMHNTNAIARSQLSNDLMISGVPYTPNEDLLSYFRSWCLVLGYVDASIPLVDIRRLSKSPIREGANCFILVQFAITNQRNDFFGKYLRHRSLSLAQIGFKSDKRVYVNENLVPTVRKIKSKALELRKEGKLNRVFTRGGIVYVSLPNSGQDSAVRSEDELRQVVNNVQQTFP